MMPCYVNSVIGICKRDENWVRMGRSLQLGGRYLSCFRIMTMS
jgi:hypothetical protein